MTYHYFVSFATTSSSGGLGFGNAESVRKKPLLTIADVQGITRDIETQMGFAKGELVIMSFALLRTEPNQITEEGHDG